MDNISNDNKCNIINILENNINDKNTKNYKACFNKQTSYVEKNIKPENTKYSTNILLNKSLNINNNVDITNEKILGEDDLNSILFDLKKHYNKLTTKKNTLENNLSLLKKQNESYETKINYLDNLKDIKIENSGKIIEVKDNKNVQTIENNLDITSINNNIKNNNTKSNFFNDTKGKTIQRINYLIEEKETLKENLINEEEYTNTLKHMIDVEKNKINKINKNINEYENKCDIITLSKKNLDKNINEQKKKETIYNTVKNKLGNENKKLDDVMKKQADEIEKLSLELCAAKTKLEKKKQYIDDLTKQKEKDLEEKKKEIKEKVIESESKQSLVLSTEKFYVKLILGVYILQKYFVKSTTNDSKNNLDINSKNSCYNFDEKSLIESCEYKYFLANDIKVGKYSDIGNVSSNKFELINKGSSVLSIKNNLIINNKKSLKNISERSSSYKNNTNNNFYCNSKASNKNNILESNINNTKENLYKTQANFNTNNNTTSSSNLLKSKSVYIDINDIINKFNTIDINFDKVYNLYTKLNSQINHYHNTMINFNLKQINLEAKKDQYTKRVKNILANNYKNFDDLVKNNSRFANFMSDYTLSIKNKYLKKLDNYVIDIDEIPYNINNFYFVCNRIISEFKAFFEYIYNK